jgi:glycosyltransferase involved in cell wall biosynthesis
MPGVLIFRSELLAISETFIAAQAGALRRFTPRFAGLRRVNPSLALPQDAIVAGERHVRLYKELGIAPAFHRQIRAAEVRLVHAHFALDGVLALHIVRRLQVPLVVTLHGYDVTVSDEVLSQSRTGRLYLKRRRQMWQEASVFLCVSEFLRGAALKAGFPEAKLRVHSIGVDRREFPVRTLPADPCSVLFVGRLVEKKGCEVLIRAMQTVQQGIPHATLTVVGDGPLRRSLEELAAALGVRCEFTGVAGSSLVQQLLRQAAVVCVPSRTAANGDSEGLPIVVLEAQSMGVPVVGTWHAGIPEAVLHGQTGLLGAEGDFAALAANLTLLLQNEKLRLEYGARGAQRIAERFDLQLQTGQLEEIYDEVVRRGRTADPSATLRFARDDREVVGSSIG